MYLLQSEIVAAHPVQISSKSSTLIRTRSLRDIYEQIEEASETNMFFRYANHESLTFKRSFKNIMNIQKNDT